ncbi:hypothetical protein ZYGR_0I06030 [Zygosaccharomyces rouxii]|uniref:ZYRO0C14322p n=2 Tax=Zygosaccharomyces rouxii TaxID=4956 RepID=C5DU68_ZYGRC|nr:uncharacterized protein ZYRO0C14322g [Zygosaccharomyces rouxii]KAH9201495.1 hypothetical protein LQ764DRAFT_176885 [Zygosaccharomyces rouxii]GAV48306.1 hypothetical protein ZYGR_0I06030 [Zygosaccharomyces rouxii]CAR27329.1 ZYRO0C14322p [Zygosaccharomyces rouxii]
MPPHSTTGLRGLQWTIRDHLSYHQLDRFKTLLNDRITTLHGINHLNLGESLLYFNPLLKQLSSDGYLDYQSPSRLLSNDSITWKRRVWAQGELESLKPLMMDQEYVCQESIKFVKKIRTDYFVCMQRSILSLEGELNLRELRTLVYTNSPVNDMIKPDHLQGQVISQFKFSEMDIISYTLLSLNSHKVHWDKNYCQDVEGYRDIIVQGPFAVQVLMAFAHYHWKVPISKVKYKNINFIYPEVNMDVCINERSIWMRDQKVHDKIYVWAQI